MASSIVGNGLWEILLELSADEWFVDTMTPISFNHEVIRSKLTDSFTLLLRNQIDGARSHAKYVWEACPFPERASTKHTFN